MGLLTIVEPVSEPVSVAEMNTYLRLDSDADDPLIAGLLIAARRWCEVYTQRRFLYQTIRLLMDFFPGYVDFKLTGQRVSSPFVSGSNAVLVGIRYAIALPYPPVANIVNFQYQDENGEPITMMAATDYIQDLASQPARLMPLFGQMWPVARVVANAVQVDYVVGYGGQITCSIADAAAVLTAVSGYTFTQNDVGSPISIPGAAGTDGALNTTIESVDDNGNATLAANAAVTVAGVASYLGKPVPEMIKVAIKFLVAHWNENRVPDDSDIPRAVKAILTPYRDLRL